MRVEFLPLTVQHLFSVIVISLMLTWAVPASADTDAQPEETAKVEQKAPPNKRICKRVSVTGSHLKQRVCMKQRDWDEMRRIAQDAVRESQINATRADG